MLWGGKKRVLAALFIALVLLASLPHAAPQCRLEGETCQDDYDCCSGGAILQELYCDATYHCAQDPGNCGHRGYFCSAAASNDPHPQGTCCAGFDCNTVCTEPCRADGATCGYSSQCCSEICDPQAKTCKEQADALAIDYHDIYLWVGLSVAIAATFLGLAYMAGKLFSLQMLDAWVKIELQELMASLVIAVFCVALIAGLNSAAQFLTKEGNAIDAAGNFLRAVHADGRELYGKVGMMYYSAAKLSSYSYTMGVSVDFVSTSLSASPAAGLSPLVGEIGQGMDSVANFMLLAASQYSFLQFFATAASVMLPLGIFLRSFSLTRKVGGMVLAAVIASSVVYPASFLVSREVYTVFAPSMRNEMRQVVAGGEAGNAPLAGMICDPFMQMFVMSPLPPVGGEGGWSVVICTPLCVLSTVAYATCWQGCYETIQTVFYIIKSLFPFIMAAPLLNYVSNNAIPSELVSNYYDPAVQHALPAISQYSVLSLVVFLVPVIITMVLLRNLAVTFGGEPQLYGLSKLV